MNLSKRPVCFQDVKFISYKLFIKFRVYKLSMDTILKVEATLSDIP